MHKDNGNLPAVRASTQVSTFESALDYTDRELLDALKKTVAKDTSDAEFRVFIELCKVSGLNPLQKQIWCFKGGDKLITMAGINGFFEVANRHPEYDGMETECKDPLNPIAVTCRVYRKDRSRPSVAIALLKEFKKNTPIWNAAPYHMLCKVAKAIALREAFSQRLSGIYIPEEIDGETPSKLDDLRAIEQSEPRKDKPTKLQKLEQMKADYASYGVPEDEIVKHIGCSLEEAKTAQLNELASMLKDIKSGVDTETWFPTVQDDYLPGFDDLSVKGEDA